MAPGHRDDERSQVVAETVKVPLAVGVGMYELAVLLGFAVCWWIVGAPYYRAGGTQARADSLSVHRSCVRS